MIYEGQEKYLFISYAHRDSEKILPIIKARTDAIMALEQWQSAKNTAGGTDDE